MNVAFGSPSFWVARRIKSWKWMDALEHHRSKSPTVLFKRKMGVFNNNKDKYKIAITNIWSFKDET